MASAIESTPRLGDDDVAALDRLRAIHARLKAELGRVIIGQEETIERLAICLFARGHSLLMGVPGLAKTLLVSKLAETVSLKFSRIQFTPDLMPMDITGTDILQETAEGRREFHFVPGPVFANIVLADEINRAPPKTQAAMLEAMQEHKVTVVGKTFKLDPPFFVLATQNPVEQEGTYPLPEAQLDRFMFKVRVSYPSKQEELEIIERMTSGEAPTARKVGTLEVIAEARQLVVGVHVTDKIKRYVVDLVCATRTPRDHGLPELAEWIAFGASPRASIYLTLAAKAHAFLRKRAYVLPEDVKAVAPDVLRHRILLSYEAEAAEVNVDEVVRRILATLKVP